MCVDYRALNKVTITLLLFRPDFKSRSIGLVDLSADLGCWELAAWDESELASVAI